MNTQRDSRKADLAKIHLAIKELGWDDDTYRTVLWTIARVRSAADLDAKGRHKLISHLKSKGWRPKPSRGTTKRKLADDGQSKKIRALWLHLHSIGGVRNPSEAALGAFVKRMTGTDALQWLSTEKAGKVIEELKKWVARVEEGNETRVPQ
ncbi:MAG: gp16 family protein [Pseudomonadota bacterium]